MNERFFSSDGHGSSVGERARGWHVQYDDIAHTHNFIRDPADLVPFDPDAARLDLTLEHRGVEALRAETTSLRSTTTTLNAAKIALEESLVALQVRLDAEWVEAAAQRSAAGELRAEAARVESAVRGPHRR